MGARVTHSEALAMQWRAQYAAQNAVKRGLLPHPRSVNCVDCGGSATEYDHRSYAQPLKVDAVCHACNLQRGRAIEFGGRIDARGHVGGRPIRK